MARITQPLPAYLGLCGWAKDVDSWQQNWHYEAFATEQGDCAVDGDGVVEHWTILD